MSDILLKAMGGIDIVAGILILVTFDFKLFAMIFGLLMISKGGLSLIG
jgi:hypothetical protein